MEETRKNENSPSHLKSFTMWKEVERRITFGIGIDTCTEAMIQSEKQRWREVNYASVYQISCFPKPSTTWS